MSKCMYDELCRTTNVLNAARIARLMGVTLAQVQLWNRQREAFLRTRKEGV